MAEKAKINAQQLKSIIDSARKIMRKDKGLNGDLDRLPMLTWIMFLKLLDDMDKVAETEALLSGERYEPVIESPYRWRDWASAEDGITGDELISFINQEKTTLPDGENGFGLLAYLKSLNHDGKSRRDVIGNIFSGTVNRMINGYLLRDVINKINEIHFDSTEEMNLLGTIYETMLREMRDAAGDSGEFYTPRAVVKFMVKMVNPELGETVLDPACGTGGFLTETYTHLSEACKTVDDFNVVQNEAILGQEAKPLPYLLAQMNLILHGLEYPKIIFGNTLEKKISEIGDNERVDIILTNPPFGGEEEDGIKANFPADMQTSETDLLFLQYIMRKLRRNDGTRYGRAAVVVPDGFLFGTGVCEKIKEYLVENMNLHTIIRLPFGVFEPYTPIRSNILFFDNRENENKGTWFYEVPIADGRKKYSKTKPILFSEFSECIKWWTNREENKYAWFVSSQTLKTRHYDFAVKNPNAVKDIDERNISEVFASMNESSENISQLLKQMSEIVEG